MATWTYNLSDVGLGHLAGRNPEVQFHLNAPQVGNGGQVYATAHAKSTPDSTGAGSVDLVDTSAMLGDAWLEMHVRWSEPGMGGAQGSSPVDVHIKTPLRTNATGGKLTDSIGVVSNLAHVLLGLTQPPGLLRGQLWWKTDPTDPYGPDNTGLIFIGG